jgi:acetolactate synthase-1/2/3 large subunit
MMESPDQWPHHPVRSGRLINDDTFRKSTLPESAPSLTEAPTWWRVLGMSRKAVREAFVIAKSGRPGPVLIDITKDAQQSSCEFDWDAAAPSVPGWRSAPETPEAALAHAAAILNSAERPVILAGHGVMISGAMDELRALAERAQIPVAMTLLGIGGMAASHPLNIGMMGMHGESWVNHAIREADLIAAGMRFDDRVTGNLKTYAPHARKIHIGIDPSRSTRTSRSMPRSSVICEPCSSGCCGGRQTAILDRASTRSRRLRGPRHSVAA